MHAAPWDRLYNWTDRVGNQGKGHPCGAVALVRMAILYCNDSDKTRGHLRVDSHQLDRHDHTWLVEGSPDHSKVPVHRLIDVFSRKR